MRVSVARRGDGEAFSNPVFVRSGRLAPERTTPRDKATLRPFWECDGCVSFMLRSATAPAERTSKRSEPELLGGAKVKRIALLILAGGIVLPAQPRRTADPSELSLVPRQTAHFQ